MESLKPALLGFVACHDQQFAERAVLSDLEKDSAQQVSEDRELRKPALFFLYGNRLPYSVL